MKLLRSGRWCAVSAWVFSVAGAAAVAGSLSPLVVSSNHRYLQDGQGRPFFLVGDCPQNLPLKLTVAEFDGYMAECAMRGFNLLWICIDGQTSDRPLPGPPRDRQERPMMTNGWDIGTLNVSYFLTIDAIAAAADRHGLYCMFTPLSECQWSQANIDRNPPEKWEAYGRFLGARYRDRGNILWQFGNDKFNARAQRAIVRGIKAAGDAHLMTVNVTRNFLGGGVGSAWLMKHERGEAWIDLDAWYRNTPPRENGAVCYWQKLEYERPNPMPTFLTEGVYQQPYPGVRGNANATDLMVRMQNYYVALGGGCGGQVYGAGWLAEKWDYEGYRDNGGRIQAKHFKKLCTEREWWTLVPDYGHAFVTAGYGTLSPTTMDYVGAAINPAGTLGLAYCPQATNITVDLAKFSAPVTARWFDPTNGRLHAALEGSPFAHRGSREFTTPGLNIAGCEDWVLVLEIRPAEAAARKSGAP